MHYQFIYLIGVEGAGKSTQAKLLKRWLSSEGYNTRLVSIRTGHLEIHLFRNLIKYPRKACETGSWRRERTPQRLKKLFPLLLFFEIVNTLILALVQVFLPLALNYVVIAEEYVIDVCNDLQRRCKKFGVGKNTTKLVLKNLLKFMPSPSIVINLDVSHYNELVHRYKRRQTNLEPIDYINLRTRQICQFAPLFDNYYYINTEKKTVMETFQEILRILTKTPEPKHTL